MTVPSAARPRSRPRFSGLAWRRARWGYVFIAPWIVGFLAFTALPMIATLAFTFSNINLNQAEPLQFVGLRNYQTLVSDQRTWDSLAVTLKFAVLALPVGVCLPFVVALLLHSRHLRGSGAFRVLFFLPYVVPFVAGVFVWQGMLSADTGWVNGLLKFLGISHPPDWLQDPTWIYPGLVIMGLWGIGGGMIIYLAGLKGIPSDLYEAAKIDGAGAFATLRHITIPMMSPVIFFTIVLGVVDVLQYFLVPLVLKNGTGEPGGSTNFFNLYLYQNFFTFQNMSYGATLAWLLFAISLGLTLLLVRSARHWVYYAGEARGAVAGVSVADLEGLTARPRLFGRRRAETGGSRPPRERGDSTRSFALTLIAIVALALFLSPMLRSVVYAVKSTDQITQAGTPLWPADPVTFSYQGKDLPLLVVPLPDGSTRQLALFEPGRKSSTFIDPAAPDAAPIAWQGSWRTLDHIWQFAPHWENFAKVWDLIDYPRLLFNTLAIAIISTIGTLLSCTLVAYGFARFKFAGRSFLFTLLIATIFLPTAVTIIPTYTIFQKLGWVGTWLPLLVPTFFANAYDVFLMRQYFMTIPTEMDEAAAIDGAGPFRTLISVILPQAWPVVIAVAIFHLVYAWNDFFGPLIYLSSNPDIQTIALGLQRFNGVHYRDPGLIQAGTLMTLIIPVIAFLLTQRFFTRGIVITGVDK